MKDFNNNKISRAYPYKYNNKHKNLWIILNDNIKKNLSNYKINNNVDKLTISQYYADVTYSWIPKCKYIYKIFVICGYDLILDKSVLCLFCLIMGETEQTFNFLFNNLKALYKFNPHIVICDYQLTLRLAFKDIFKDVKLYPCYYHFMRSIRKNLL